MGKTRDSSAAMVTAHDPCRRRASLRKTIVVLILSIFAQATGNVFLSMKMKEIGNNNWSTFFSRAVESPTLWFGTALLIIAFIFFAAALSWADLSFVVPAVSAEVVVNVLFANYFLDEVVSLTRWTGVLFISLGVILVLRSERQRVNWESKEIPTSGGR
jgi:drug/metabolite transporter (DMT)-like permease